jgi:hypothetical protein
MKRSTRQFLTSVVIAAALLLTAYNGSLNYLLLLAFAIVLVQGWKAWGQKLLESLGKAWARSRHDSCDPDR